MRHAAIGGGKRLRPLLVVAACELYHVDRRRALRVGLAVECVHVSSLIPDDLPCMDDDDLRRGRPTVQQAWGESSEESRVGNECVSTGRSRVCPALYKDTNKTTKS